MDSSLDGVQLHICHEGFRHDWRVHVEASAVVCIGLSEAEKVFFSFHDRFLRVGHPWVGTWLG